MNIDWGAFGSVFGVSVIGTVGLVGLFTLGIAGLSRQEAAEARKNEARGGRRAGASAPLARGSAYVCFALCAAAVAYGIYLIAM